ncbi:spermosin-like [Paramacrobiotus metropolitanus]|uniref:spermosin-like n=1 Tax=Paramacrobiotus metropolitanus TaxID=2943436 RepID=UPI00244596D3|nr:spermosin-like [Paramacrobiotus metropolitanus]
MQYGHIFVAIEKKNSSRCQHGSSRLRSDRIVCIGSTLTADACSGDSGGPLACFDPREHRFYLAGATSYGFGTPPNKCASGELARYTDVPAYVDWIANVTQTEVVT